MANTYSVDLELSSSQYLTINDNASLSQTGDITLEAWIKLEQLPSTATTTFTIVSKGAFTGAGLYTWIISTSDNQMDLFFTDGSSNRSKLSATGYTFSASDVGVWRHVAVSVDVSAPTGQFYVDAKPVTTAVQESSATSIGDGSDPFRIGATATPDSYFDGKIDNVRLWSDIRTASEIETNFHVTTPADTTNLVSQWEFENDYTDSIGSNDLTASGSPVFASDPGFTESESFSLDLELGSSQYASISDSAQTGLDITGDISVEAWINLETLASVAGTSFGIAGKYDFTANRSYTLYITSANKLSFVFSHDGTNTTSVTESTASLTSTGVWYHVAATADVSAGASGVTLYVNASAQTDADDSSNSTAIYNSTASFAIGARDITGTPTNFFDGLIDEVRVWSDVRTSGEISANYQSIIDPDSANLVGYWRFENNYADLTDNNNSLIPVASPIFSTNVPFVYTPPVADVSALGSLGLLGVGA